MCRRSLPGSQHTKQVGEKGNFFYPTLDGAHPEITLVICHGRVNEVRKAPVNTAGFIEEVFKPLLLAVVKGKSSSARIYPQIVVNIFKDREAGQQNKRVGGIDLHPEVFQGAVQWIKMQHAICRCLEPDLTVPVDINRNHSVRGHDRVAAGFIMLLLTGERTVNKETVTGCEYYQFLGVQRLNCDDIRSDAQAQAIRHSGFFIYHSQGPA